MVARRPQQLPPEPRRPVGGKGRAQLDASGFAPSVGPQSRRVEQRVARRIAARANVQLRRVREDGERLLFGDPVELFKRGYSGSTPIRSYDVSSDGRFLLHRHVEGDVVGAVVEQVFPDRIQVVQGWLDELQVSKK